MTPKLFNVLISQRSFWCLSGDLRGLVRSQSRIVPSLNRTYLSKIHSKYALTNCRVILIAQ